MVAADANVPPVGRAKGIQRPGGGGEKRRWPPEGGGDRKSPVGLATGVGGRWVGTGLAWPG